MLKQCSINLENKKENDNSVTIEGTIERITFRNEENGFSILRVKVKNNKDLVTIVATINKINIGESISASGKWHNDLRYGLQLKAENIITILPSTENGIKKYLGSGIIKGIGKHFASKVVKKFGTEAISIIETSPERLTEIEGIGQHRADIIAKSWMENKTIRDIMIFLQGHNVSTAIARKIFKHYGHRAIDIVQQNPYKIATDIKGIGFLSADKIAINLGISLNSVERAQAGVIHILNEASSMGHCGLPKTQLIEKAVKILEIDLEKIENGINAEIQQRRLVLIQSKDLLDDKILKQNNSSNDKNGVDIKEAMLFLPKLLEYEQYIAHKLFLIKKENTKFHNIINTKSALHWLKENYRIKLSSSQQNALETILTNKVTVITGGPGTGKTTLINALVIIISNYYHIVNSNAKKVVIKLAAPTGRAAKRLSESTKKYASTIHRMLEFDPAIGKFKHREDNPLKCDLLVLDESSMIDIQLMCLLLQAINSNTQIVLVGDIDQLPSVGPGQVLFDIINSNTAAVVTLNKIFRQAANSNIIINSHLINKGYMPKLVNRNDNDQQYYSHYKNHIDSSTNTPYNNINNPNSDHNLGNENQVLNKINVNTIHDNPQQKSNIRDDFWFYEATDPIDAIYKLKEIITKNLLTTLQQLYLPSSYHYKSHNIENTNQKNHHIIDIKDIKYYAQILSPMQKGSLGVKSLNIELQKILNPPQTQEIYIERFGYRYSVGDKVMQIENNYEKMIFNGDIGFIEEINQEEEILIINFDQRSMEYQIDELEQLTLAYATTIHKSQGSEYPIIIMPIMTQHFMMLNKNLLYTGITRGKKLTIIIGQRKAIAMAVKNAVHSTRYTTLCHWLRACDNMEKNIEN